MSTWKNKLDKRDLHVCFVVLLELCSTVASLKALEPLLQREFITLSSWDTTAFEFTPVRILSHVLCYNLLPPSTQKTAIQRDAWGFIVLCRLSDILAHSRSSNNHSLHELLVAPREQCINKEHYPGTIFRTKEMVYVKALYVFWKKGTVKLQGITLRYCMAHRYSALLKWYLVAWKANVSHYMLTPWESLM